MTTQVEYKFEKIVKETDKAWLLEIDSAEIWIPKSASEINGNIVKIPHWFASKMDKQGALFSDDLRHRYVLWRIWNPRKRIALCIGLNPSTANKSTNDHTRLMQTLVKRNYGGMQVVNLFTLISPSPESLLNPSSIGDEKTDMGIIFAYSLGCDDVIFCWGTFDEAKERAKKVIEWFSNALCFGVNKDGSPWHPMALMYAGLKPDKARLFLFKGHTFDQNYYDRKDKKKKAEYNAKQIPLIKPIV